MESKRIAELEVENSELTNAVVAEALRVRDLKDILRRTLPYVAFGPHPEGPKSKCPLCKLVKDIRRVLR